MEITIDNTKYKCEIFNIHEILDLEKKILNLFIILKQVLKNINQIQNLNIIVNTLIKS